MVRFTALVTAFLSVTLIVALTAINEAHACSPGESHWGEITADDTPECLRVSGPWENNAGMISVDNTCDVDAVFEALECGACDSNIVVAAGEYSSITVESRTHHELGSGTETEQVYNWTMDNQTGRIETTVTVRDNSRDCGYFCSSTGSGATAPVGHLGGLALILVLVFGYRRRDNGEYTS